MVLIWVETWLCEKLERDLRNDAVSAGLKDRVQNAVFACSLIGVVPRARVIIIVIVSHTPTTNQDQHQHTISRAVSVKGQFSKFRRRSRMFLFVERFVFRN